MRFKIPFSLLCASLICLATASFAQAHFLFLVMQPASGDAPATAHVYFSEVPEADDPKLLERLGDVKIHVVGKDGKTTPVDLKMGEESLTAPLKDDQSVIVLSHTYGLFSRGDAPMLLNYRSKTGPVLGHAAWKNNTSEVLDLDLIPSEAGDKIKIQALWKGQPAKGLQVVVMDPDYDDQELETNAEGVVMFSKKDNGNYTIRVRHSDETAGKYDGKDYASSRFYTTLVLPVGVSEPKLLAGEMLPAFPEPVTSFGGAVLDKDLYVYGGHLGSAHSYHNLSQSNQLWKLSLDKPTAWEKVATGPRLQGLAMVAHGGKLYRVGGFMAKNPEGEDNDLWSQSDFVSFDPKAGEWRDLPALPEPRSSHDAAVIGDTLFVVGGWHMAGPDDTAWHTTAWSCDLSQEKKEWKSLPEAPFARRALSLAAHDGKLYCIGGMQESGGPTKKVAIYDPKTESWTEGPELKGEKPIAGFGSSAFAVNGHLYVSTIEGSLQRLSDNGKNWKEVGKLERARFFHRMLPVENSKLLFVAGANMGIGKFEEVEVLDVE